MALEEIQTKIVYQENVYLLSGENVKTKYRPAGNPIAAIGCLGIFGIIGIVAGIYEYTNAAACDDSDYMCKTDYNAVASILTIGGGICSLGSITLCAYKCLYRG